MAVWSGWLAGTAWLAAPQPWLAPLLLTIVVSFWDDRYGVPAWTRLLVQTMAACGWVWLSEMPLNPFAAVVAIVWMANLFNFMDGSDGLALAMALIGFGAYAVAGSMAGAGDAPILWALVAAIAPCLVTNFPPAKLFMGDVGAVPLGFVAATFGIPGAIATEAGLSFLGLGVRPPLPSWGILIAEGVRNMRAFPHELLFPAVVLAVTLICFNFLGDGLRDALDPKLKVD